ncbi:MAG: hypothetical protein LBJ71_04325 [Holosporaceae bacterium]|jgi:hypothetical protein|nr:hypothetical protein [Holosporaceae bacterium]
MQDELWAGYVSCKGMNITDLSKTLRDAVDSLNQGVVFRETEYRFDEASLKEYICVVCKNQSNLRKIVKKSGALSLTFVDTLQSGNDTRLPFIANTIRDESDLKGLYDKIKKLYPKQ